MIDRDENGVAHIVALSGGHDSSILAVELQQREPRPYNYVCTPTGNELPAMFEHWADLSERLGKRILPIMADTLTGVIAKQGMLPNFRARFCTRILKIEPYRKFLIEQAAIGPVVSYVGLRADEPGRAGGVYDDIDGITMRFPLREWGMGETEVQAGLAEHGIRCPDRTDCALCYHQRLGEWYELWLNHRSRFLQGEMMEASYGATFRTPGRDTWPSGLAEMRARFEAGDKPDISLNRLARERQASGNCRVCSL